MNLVGKILVMAVFVMALVFCSFTVAVHSTHTNWKDRVENKVADGKKPLGYRYQVEQKDAQIARLQSELSEKQRILERNKREAQQRLGQLETRRAELEADRDAKLEENLRLATALQEATESSKAATDVLTSIREENDTLREQNKIIRKDRDDSLRDVVNLQDKLANAQGEASRLDDRNKQLLGQLADYRAVLLDRGFPLNLETPTVVGKVQAADNTEGLVEINLGTDDGLKLGDTLNVYRVGATLAKTQFLGRIQLINTDKRVSVGRILKKYQEGTIQRNDDVATRFAGSR